MERSLPRDQPRTKMAVLIYYHLKNRPLVVWREKPNPWPMGTVWPSQPAQQVNFPVFRFQYFAVIREARSKLMKPKSRWRSCFLASPARALINTRIPLSSYITVAFRKSIHFTIVYCGGFSAWTPQSTGFLFLSEGRLCIYWACLLDDMACVEVRKT